MRLWKSGCFLTKHREHAHCWQFQVYFLCPPPPLGNLTWPAQPGGGKTAAVNVNTRRRRHFNGFAASMDKRGGAEAHSFRPFAPTPTEKESLLPLSLSHSSADFPHCLHANGRDGGGGGGGRRRPPGGAGAGGGPGNRNSRSRKDPCYTLRNLHFPRSRREIPLNLIAQMRPCRCNSCEEENFEE